MKLKSLKIKIVVVFIVFVFVFVFLLFLFLFFYNKRNCRTTGSLLWMGSLGRLRMGQMGAL